MAQVNPTGASFNGEIYTDRLLSHEELTDGPQHNQNGKKEPNPVVETSFGLLSRIDGQAERIIEYWPTLRC
jgi:hypothetical protein